jgi:hypothetical protein
MLNLLKDVPVLSRIAALQDMHASGLTMAWQAVRDRVSSQPIECPDCPPGLARIDCPGHYEPVTLLTRFLMWLGGHTWS